MPKITVGRYAGTPIDQLPNSYLRWMLTQKFPKDWLDIAERKVKASPYNNSYIEISRHAIDQFSLRFLERWKTGRKGDTGIATYLATMAQDAWAFGTDRSKRRHADDGVVKELEGIQFVFGYNPAYPDYKDLITVMASGEKISP